MSPSQVDQEEFRRTADLVLQASKGDDTTVYLADVRAGNTRFANNEVVQNLNTRRLSIVVHVAFGQQHGTATSTDLAAGAVRETLRRAERVARAAPPDPEYLPPVGPQHYSDIPTARTETAATGPQRRLADARVAIELCAVGKLVAAGLVANSSAAVGVAANSGLFGFEERTEARFSVTATGEDSSGWAANVHRSMDHLGVRERTQIAINKAKRAAHPQEIAAGRYTVILEPAAVAGLLSAMIWMLDAKSYYKGDSAFAGKLGQCIMDSRLTLKNCPDHPDLLGTRFTHEGLPSNDCTWINKGVLQELMYDRYTAQQHQVARICTLGAPRLSAQSGTGTVEDLIRTTQQGILVTNFWYIRTVNPTDLTLTGMTRDGTFLVEGGEISTPTHNFRFHESPLSAFKRIDAFTTAAEASTTESNKMLVPALKIDDFNFSSVTRF
ncbi:MAG TPA: TldD/PmbA family protein [Nitrospirales bacterium]|jgi:predicted Zn-dependent protease